MTSSQTYTYPSHIPFDTDGLTSAQADAAVVQIARRIVAPVLRARRRQYLAALAADTTTIDGALYVASCVLGGAAPTNDEEGINAILNVARYNLYDPVLGFDYGGADVARAEATKIEHEVRGG